MAHRAQGSTKHDQSKRETDWRGGQSLELVGAAMEGTAHDRKITKRMVKRKKRKQSNGFLSLVPWTRDKGMAPEAAYRTWSISDRFIMLVDTERAPWVAKSYQEMLGKFGVMD